MSYRSGTTATMRRIQMYSELMFDTVTNATIIITIGHQ
ncbi:hypothetical protein BIWAKO_04119 [Bosea sp. BIWAKO-01]|nr:hypothetical protein BIWAKO_04119 [Bosea sp. BIWAKO-01]